MKSVDNIQIIHYSVNINQKEREVRTWNLAERKSTLL
nr:MAG TPA: hypothetical protein [Caudoviricetes sp.]